MLHELISMFIGSYNGIFNNQNISQVKLNKYETNFISTSEVELLQRSCTMGTQVFKVKEFIRKFQHDPSKVENSANRPQHGIYTQALVQAMREMLDDFNEQVRQLELQLLASDQRGTCFIQNYMSNYEQVFPTVLYIIDEMNTRDISGCKILELVYSGTQSGFPFVCVCLDRMLATMHGFFYKQLMTWMVYGDLEESTEFYIQQRPQENADKAKTLNNFSESHKCDPALHVQDDTCNLWTLCQQLDAIDASVDTSYYVDETLVPNHLPRSMVQHTLFVGSSIGLFVMAKHRDIYTVKDFEEKKMDFRQKLNNLANESTKFNVKKLKSIIEDFRTYIAEELWKLIVEASNLVHILCTFKKSFLMSRGEIWLSFLEHANPYIDEFVSNVKISRHMLINNLLFNINCTFRTCWQSVDVDEFDDSEKFNLELDDSVESENESTIVYQSPKEEKWNLFSLDYNVDWPLKIIFTPNVMKNYKKVFKFLLRLKRTQIKLHKIIAQRIYRRKSRNCTNITILYHKMLNFVDSLEYYFQIDVIENAFAQMLENIYITRDFDVVQQQLQNFIANVVIQCFLTNKMISTQFTKIILDIEKFCIKMENGMEADEDIYCELNPEFSSKMSKLFSHLRSLYKVHSQLQINKLICKFDFNNYYTDQEKLEEDICASGDTI